MLSNEVQVPPDYELAIKVVARPDNANPKGDIFGGWLMAQIDLGGSLIAVKRAKGAVATAAVKHLQFLQPLFIHDIVSFYSRITHIGKTSITVSVIVSVERAEQTESNDFAVKTLKAAEAELVYVAITEPGKKREVPVA